jgi:hypothetical protein
MRAHGVVTVASQETTPIKMHLATAILILGLLFLATFHAGRMVLLTVALVIVGGGAFINKASTMTSGNNCRDNNGTRTLFMAQ